MATYRDLKEGKPADLLKHLRDARSALEKADEENQELGPGLGTKVFGNMEKLIIKAMSAINVCLKTADRFDV